MSHIMKMSSNSRRHFLQHAGLGCGSLALTNLLHQQGIHAQNHVAEVTHGKKTCVRIGAA